MSVEKAYKVLSDLVKSVEEFDHPSCIELMHKLYGYQDDYFRPNGLGNDFWAYEFVIQASIPVFDEKYLGMDTTSSFEKMMELYYKVPVSK